MRAILSLLVLASAALAQTKGPADVTVAPGRLAAVPLTTDADESEYVVLGDIDCFREYDPSPKTIKLRVIGYTPGTSYVVLSSVKGGKLQPIFTVKVIVSGTPAPKPPEPKPPTPPTPKVDPPIAGDGLRMLVVWESADLSKYPSGIVQAMTSAEVRDYLRRKCPKGPDGVTPEFRIFDKDQSVASESATWRDAKARADKAGRVPWLLVSNGKDGYDGPLPESAGTLLDILKKYGGP